MKKVLNPALETNSGYAIVIGSSGRVSIPSNNHYNFGTEDFTAAAWFQTKQAGTIVSRKATDGTPGWLLVLKPGGSFKLATDNGNGFYEADSVQTNALDGNWHHVAAIRNLGAISIYFDGDLIASTPRSNLPTPLNVSNNLSVIIGGCDQAQEPFNQFVGELEDVGLWNRALSRDQIITLMFGPINDSMSGMVGFWGFNKNYTDSSPVGNNGTPTGATAFVAVCDCVFAKGENHYQYCCMDNRQAADPVLSKSFTNQTISRSQTIQIDNGSPMLIGGITDASDTLQFPVGALLTLTDPNGRALNIETNTADRFIHMSGNSLFAFTIKNPQAGIWTLSVTAPQTTAFVITFQSLPSLDPINTCVTALRCCYPQSTPGYVARGFDSTRVASLMSFWGTLGQIVGYGIAVAGVAALAVGSVTLIPAALIVLGGLAVAQAVFVIDTSVHLSTLSETSNQISQAVGFNPNIMTNVGLALDGGYMSLPSNPAYNFGTGDFTTEGWVRPTKPGPLFGKKSTQGGNSADAGFLFQVNENGVISLVTDNGFGYYLVNSRDTSAFDGNWHHIAAVRQSGIMTMYFDGQPIDSTIVSNLPTPLSVNNSLPLLIGGVAQEQQKYRNLHGTIADVRLWNIARSREDIKSHQFSSPAPDSPGLVGMWPLTTSNTVDLSITGNNGQLTGTTSWVIQPGQQLSQVQLGRNAAHGYEYVGEHTFMCVMQPGAQNQPYPDNVNIFFDCAGGHGDDANHKVPVTLGTIVVYGRPDDLIRMATGSAIIDPTKKVYGSGSEWGQGTAGINATGTINREGFCHQIANRLLWACVWPNREITMANAVPEVIGYYTTWLWTGTYGKSWASIINGKQVSFAEWCSRNDFPAPPSEDTSMYNDLKRFDTRHRKILMRHAIELQESIDPAMSKEELTELKNRFDRNASAQLPKKLLSYMGLIQDMATA